MANLSANLAVVTLSAAKAGRVVVAIAAAAVG